jgi:hypothetical protein
MQFSDDGLIPHVLFTELESTAEEQTEAFLGTPGSLAERTNEAGVRFRVHRYSDATGRRREIYLGKVNDAAATELVATLRVRIASANAAIAAVRILARAGFATVDRKAYATLASLHNHGLFRAGALLIGSHAYGALLNALGVRAGRPVRRKTQISHAGKCWRCRGWTVSCKCCATPASSFSRSRLSSACACYFFCRARRFATASRSARAILE